ncbi:MAG: DUF4445 domain-containing protein [Deltaproteobacteria bacterium]|nr:DUF4445 domain-containing protein [Deltaproteobacteria bacterium]
MKKFKVVFLPSHKEVEISEGETILDAARDSGVEIESICGGVKNCGKCKVKLLEGKLSPLIDEELESISDEEKTEGYRLACAAQVIGNAQIYVPEIGQIEKQGLKRTVAGKKIGLNPAILPYVVELPLPSLNDPTGDFDRLRNNLSERYALHSLNIDYPALLKLPCALREGSFKCTAAIWMEKEILDIKPGRSDHLYGLAIDIGTTSVAGYLCNLQNGELLATQSMMNPQVVYGEDVMSRITYSMAHPDGLEKLHRSIINGLNQLIKTIVEGCSLSPEDILDVTVVGNTAMHHLFLKIDPQYLGVSPFTPAVHQSITIKARDLGLKVHPSANVYLLPIEAGFVGADNVGVLIAEEPDQRDEMSLIIDVGTNGELVLGNRNRLLSSSCATGPAFEGAHIKFGMRATTGAIERVRVDPQTLEVDFKVIGETQWKSESKSVRARGICGSGIIDAVAELYLNGVIEKSGQLKKEQAASRLRTSGEGLEFVIAWKEETSIGRDITITQQDIRNIQLGKAALYAGARLMMKRCGVKKIDRVILAGSFGSHIDTQKAMRIGMFPECDLNNVLAVGNAAGEGAMITLLNREKRRKAEEIARKVEYLELTLEDDFQKEFIEAIAFPNLIGAP